METQARTFREVKEEIILKLNGKVVYFMLTLLIALVAWIGKDIVANTKNNSTRLEAIHDGLASLQKDFDHYTRYHALEHEELEKELEVSDIPKSRRSTSPADSCDESSN